MSAIPVCSSSGPQRHASLAANPPPLPVSPCSSLLEKLCPLSWEALCWVLRLWSSGAGPVGAGSACSAPAARVPGSPDAVWVPTAHLPTKHWAPGACPCCGEGGCRRPPGPPPACLIAERLPLPTTASLTSGLPPRHSPEGITPSNLTPGPSGFSSMRFPAGVSQMPCPDTGHPELPTAGRAGGGRHLDMAPAPFTGCLMPSRHHRPEGGR